MKKILLFFILILTLFPSVFGAEYHETKSTEDNPMTPGSAEKIVQLDVNKADYFEAGFVTEPYKGGAPVFNPDDSESNAIVLAADYNTLIASSSVYVYWFYGTAQSLKLEIGCTPLVSEAEESIPLEIAYGGEKISSENPDDRMNVFSRASSNNYTIDYGSTAPALQITTGSLLGKNAGTYTGYITLYITN